jgi:alkylation response protein AidB-like acyl-CoA dehydrogenase
VLAAAGGQDGLLRAVLGGETLVVPALMEPGGEYGPAGIRLAGEHAGGGIRLTGTKVLVPYLDTAGWLLVAARTGDGVTLALVDPGTTGIEVTRSDNIAGAPLFTATFHHVAASGLVGAPSMGWDVLAPVLDRAAVLRSAQIVGAAERLLEMSVAYARSREQFGKSIGAYQAVQYLCTDIAIAAELASLATLRAAALFDLGEPAAPTVAEAKARASAAARLAAERAHEVHAGFAFMMEADVQLFTRRLRHWELDLGDEDHHRERLADALLG